MAKKVVEEKIVKKEDKPKREKIANRVTVGVAMDALEKEMLETEAEILKMSVSSFAREALVVYARLRQKMGKDKKIFIGKEDSKVVEFKL